METAEAGMTLRDAKFLADLSIKDVKNGFIKTGYYLGLIRNQRLWEPEYSGFQEFLDANYRKDRSWASRCISLYEHFGCRGGREGLPHLAEPYEDYSVSQLIEMLSMTEEQRQQVAPDMTVRQIRELKPKREKEVPEDISAEEMPGETEKEPAGEQEEEQIHGQMNVTDNPGAVATSQQPEADATGWRQEEEENAPDESWNLGDLPQAGGGLVRNLALRLVHERRTQLLFLPYDRHEAEEKVRIQMGLMARTYDNSIPVGNGVEASACGIIIEFYEGEKDLGTCSYARFLTQVRKALEKPAEKMEEGAGNGTEDRESITETPETVAEGRENGPECQGADQEMEESATESTGEPEDIPVWAAYDRQILEKMIRDATEEMDIMREYWAEHMPDVCTEHAMRIQAYRNLLEMHEKQEEEEQEEEPGRDPAQPELPVLKNDGQRKEWLRNYQSWGLWYEDRNIGAKYYRYIFANGAILVVDEYQYDTYEGDAGYTASFLHLVGGPEPARHTKYGEYKWPYRQRYSRNPDSETELVEFLKALQQKGEQKK